MINPSSVEVAQRGRVKARTLIRVGNPLLTTIVRPHYATSRMSVKWPVRMTNPRCAKALPRFVRWRNVRVISALILISDADRPAAGGDGEIGRWFTGLFSYRPVNEIQFCIFAPLLWLKLGCNVRYDLNFNNDGLCFPFIVDKGNTTGQMMKENVRLSLLNCQGFVWISTDWNRIRISKSELKRNRLSF